MMKKLLARALSTTIAVAAAATAALAIDTTLRVNYVDRDAGVITLGGDSVIVPEGFDISALSIGTLVTATYDDTGEEPFQATAITIH